MSVHQVEQYYVHISIVDCDKAKIEKAKKWLTENEDDYEVTADDITVDGFESEHYAQEAEDQLNSILNG